MTVCLDRRLISSNAERRYQAWSQKCKVLSGSVSYKCVPLGNSLAQRVQISSCLQNRDPQNSVGFARPVV